MNFGISMSGISTADPEAIDAIAQEALRQLRALPGTEQVSLSGWVNKAAGGSLTISEPPDAPVSVSGSGE